MLTNMKTIIEIYMFTQFGQFNDDEDSVGLLDNVLTDLILVMGGVEDLLDFTEANEFASLGGWITRITRTYRFAISSILVLKKDIGYSALPIRHLFKLRLNV